MKNLILCVVLTTLLIGVDSAQGQVLKLRTNAFASRIINEDNIWTKWSDWSNVNILIQIVDDRVTIFSKETQIFDIMDSSDKTTNDSGCDIYVFKCTDIDGIICYLKFINAPKKSKKYSQLYVRYGDYNYVYETYFLGS